MKYSREKAVLISDINEEIAELAAKMIEILDTGVGVGLAGPQVGVKKGYLLPRHPEILPVSLSTLK